MFENDKRIVMTLDAGGTNFVFSAIAGNRELIAPIETPSQPHDPDKCLSAIAGGFEAVKKRLSEAPAAISFAFPGPADYAGGIIGDLPNFPAFLGKGGIALGPWLERRFGIPVFINNDGNLFALGEAAAGALPHVNGLLESHGSVKRYKNLLGLTLGTGFGAGVVVDGKLLAGDNGCGGDVWVFRNKFHGGMICEESVSIRAVCRVYGELASVSVEGLTPKDIFDIAEGVRDGDRDAARRSFETLGEAAGDVVSQALTIVDGIVVIGGGLTGAAKYFMPALLREMNGEIGTFAGALFPRLQMKACDLDDAGGLNSFLEDETKMVPIPGCDATVPYNTVKKSGVMVSKLGANRAISLGAYAYAIANM